MDRYLQLMHTVRNSQPFLDLTEVHRKGWLLRGVPESLCENVVHHSDNMVRAARAYTNGSDTRLFAMVLIHDLPEVIAGDMTPHDKVTEEEKWAREKAALYEVITQYDSQDAALIEELVLDYKRQDTPRSILGNQLDKLDAAVMAFRYENSGFNVDEFFPYTRERLTDPILINVLDTFEKREHPLEQSHEIYFRMLSEAHMPHYLQ